MIACRPTAQLVAGGDVCAYRRAWPSSKARRRTPPDSAAEDDRFSHSLTLPGYWFSGAM